MILNHTFEKSAMLTNASYDTIEMELTVTFTNGKFYTYIDVPNESYEGLISAYSVGRYFNSLKAELVQKK